MSLETLSDAFKSTFTRGNQWVLLNCFAPEEIPTVKMLIQKHLGWEDVEFEANDEIADNYFMYSIYRRGKKPYPPEPQATGEGGG